MILDQKAEIKSCNKGTACNSHQGLSSIVRLTFWSSSKIGLDGLLIVHAFYPEAEKVVEGALEAGEVGKLVKVLAGDLEPHACDTRLDRGIKLGEVEARAAT